MSVARFRLRALERVADIAARYESERPGLGDRFERVLFLTAELAASSPRAGRPVHGSEGLRRWNLEHFPYSFLYAEEADGIVVIAIVHHKRRSGAWRDDDE